MPIIKNIIFDLGGVLLDIDYQATKLAFENLGISNFDLLYSQMKQNELFNSLETGKIDEQDFIREINNLIPSTEKKDIYKAWNAMLKQFPKHRIDLIYSLKPKYNVVLLSNTNAIHIKAFKQHLESDFGYSYFQNAFQKIYYSSEIGLRKPNVETFLYVLNENNFKANETLFIDDTKGHLEGAKIAELHTFLHPSNGDLKKSLQKVGVLE